ncbi:MAG: aspartate carbamoyltransferase catalytic subunit [Chloroflexi bacterium]|nr:aspartate carbamoyltransferase catalytic subunit [Chloroflexota bacterium]
MTTRQAVSPDSPAGAEKKLASRHHVLDLDDFSREEIELVLDTTDAMKEVLTREIKKVPVLRGKTIFTLFYEPSTRTRSSFEQAAKVLSADVINIAAQASSVVKGESLVDTVRTIQALGADFIIIRHPQSGAPYVVARAVKAHVINAGDGWHAHPTQALLDLYTIRNRLGKIAGLRVVIVGDIAHSRVARSNIWGLTTMGAKVVLCGPPTLLPWGLDERSSCNEAYSIPPVTVETNVDRAVEGADVVMALRLQLERQQKGLLPTIREYVQLYQVNASRLAKAMPNVLVMHPGPVNEDIEISLDVSQGAQSVIQEQVSNGVAVRMALLYLLAGGNK